jgi:glyoxylase I family protein
MQIKFHHVNLCTGDVPGLDDFYRTVLDMEPEPSLNANRRIAEDGYSGEVAFITDGDIQFHLAQPDLDAAFKADKAINPLERGHLAFRTDDIEAFKRRLDEKGIRYADYGAWAMKGWSQIFFHDPAGNIIEVHQAYT